MKTVDRDRVLVASTLAPSPERLEHNQALRATVAGLALVGLLALLAVGLLSLMGCSRPKVACTPPPSGNFAMPTAEFDSKNYCRCWSGDGKWFQSRPDGICYSDDEP
jgi:hypothetical protein